MTQSQVIPSTNAKLTKTGLNFIICQVEALLMELLKGP
jgi:hypothetical protein